MTNVSARRGGRALPTLVVIHGAGGNMDTVGPFTDALAGRAYVAVSLPGRDDSEGPALDSAPALGAWLDDRVRGWELGPHVVLGFSMGGAVAIEYALRAPPHLRGLVLVSTGARLRVNPHLLERWRRAAETGEAPAPVEMMYQPDTDEAIKRRLRDASARTPLETAYADWCAADSFDRLADVSCLTLPTHLIVGSRDPLTPPKYARYLAEQVAGSQLEQLEDAGHYAISERSADVAASVNEFIESRCT